MTDKEITKKQLIQELHESRERVSALGELNQELTRRIDNLIRAEAKYRLVADNMYDCEFWLSPSAEFTYTSLACERITGYTSKEFCSDPTLLFRIIHHDDVTKVYDNMHRQRAEWDTWRA